jgi:uncharacterized membrane protein YdjX (TVP38/TMEM64 family)
VSPFFDHLGVFVLYLFVDALAFPIASMLYVAYMGERHAPWLVAVLGAVATTAGSVAQYLVVRWLLAHPRLQWAWLVRLRARVAGVVVGSGPATFWTLFVIYATPLGAGPLRVAAAAAGYPLPKFAAAILLGCLPYYATVAWLGSAIKLPSWVYAVAIVAIIAFAAVLWMSRRMRERAT